MSAKTPKQQQKSILRKSGSIGEAHTVFTACDWSIVAHLVVMVARAGGTVQLGTTQNGSAVTVRIYHAGEGENFYAGDVDAFHDLCTYWANQFDVE